MERQLYNLEEEPYRHACHKFTNVFIAVRNPRHQRWRVQRLLRKSTTESYPIYGSGSQLWPAIEGRHLLNRCRAVSLTTVTTTTKPQLLESIVAVFSDAWRRESMWLSSIVDSAAGRGESNRWWVPGDRTQYTITCSLVVTQLSCVVRCSIRCCRGARCSLCETRISPASGKALRN